jgi:hypothetical protein
MVKRSKKSVNISMIRDLRDLAIYLHEYQELFNEDGLFEDPEEREISGLMDGAHISCLSMHRLTNRAKEPMVMQKVGAYHIDLLIDGLKKLKKLGAEWVTVSNVTNGPIELLYKGNNKEFFYSLAPRVEDDDE